MEQKTTSQRHKLTKKIAARKKNEHTKHKMFHLEVCLVRVCRMSEREVLSHQKVQSFWKIAVAQVAQQTSMRKCLQLECLSLMNLFALSWIRVRVEAEMSCPLWQFLWSRILRCLYIGYLFTLPSSGKWLWLKQVNPFPTSHDERKSSFASTTIFNRHQNPSEQCSHNANWNFSSRTNCIQLLRTPEKKMPEFVPCRKNARKFHQDLIITGKNLGVILELKAYAQQNQRTFSVVYVKISHKSHMNEKAPHLNLRSKKPFFCSKLYLQSQWFQQSSEFFLLFISLCSMLLIASLCTSHPSPHVGDFFRWKNQGHRKTPHKTEDSHDPPPSEPPFYFLPQLHQFLLLSKSCITIILSYESL